MNIRRFNTIAISLITALVCLAVHRQLSSETNRLSNDSSEPRRLGKDGSSSKKDSHLNKGVKSQISSTQDHIDFGKLGFSGAIEAVRTGNVPPNRLCRLILRFSDESMRLDLIENFFLAKEYSPNEKIEVVNELSDSTSVPVWIPFGIFSRDAEFEWETILRLAGSLSNQSVRDSAYLASYSARYSDSKSYKELVSKDTFRALGTVRQSEMGRADFVVDVFSSIFTKSGFDMVQFEKFMEAVESYDGAEIFKKTLIFKIKKKEPSAFEIWNQTSGKYNDLTFEGLKEEYKQLNNN